MGSFASIFSSESEYQRTLILGLDGAGKTVILYKLALGEIVTTIPTIGFNVEWVKHKHHEIQMWDVGGFSNVRINWPHYFQHTVAVVFVVDSSDRADMDLNKINKIPLSYIEYYIILTIFKLYIA